MSVRASLLAALVVGSSLTIAPAVSASPSSPSAASAAPAAPAAPAALAALAAAPSALSAAAGGPSALGATDAVAPEVTSVPVKPEPDGTAVQLDVSVWPQTSGKHPLVLLAHGFGG